MELVSTLGALVVFLTFLVSGTLKLRDLAAVEHGFIDLGLPDPRRLSRLVPAAELGVAGLLIVATRLGATLAFAMLVGFTIYLVQLRRDGVTAPCNCFGATTGEAVGRTDLVRNVALLACAGFALFSPNLI